MNGVRLFAVLFHLSFVFCFKRLVRSFKILIIAVLADICSLHLETLIPWGIDQKRVITLSRIRSEFHIFISVKNSIHDIKGPDTRYNVFGGVTRWNLLRAINVAKVELDYFCNCCSQRCKKSCCPGLYSNFFPRLPPTSMVSEIGQDLLRIG